MFLKGIIKKRMKEAQELDTQGNASSKRELTGIWKHIVNFLCVAMALFHLYVAGWGVISQINIISTHLAFVLLIIFLLYPATKNSNTNKPTVLDIIFGILGFCTAIYVGVFTAKITGQFGIPTRTDLVSGAICIVLVVEATRRVLGKALPIIAIMFILFAYFGRFVPGTFKHAGYSVAEIIKMLYLTTEGIYGTALATSATYVILFVLFGAIMAEIGMSQFLNNLALAVAGTRTGGPAKVAAISSGLLGTISGSTTANVATTGVMTIPLMKSVGYKPEYAGAVECVASAGGQIMPPVMGAAAFLMAQFLGVNYQNIIFAAIIPAILYYFFVILSVDLRARHRKLKTLSKDQIPSIKETIILYGHMSIPLLALIYFLVIKMYNPVYAAWLSILIAVVVSFLRKSSRLTIVKLKNALVSGVKSILPVAIATASAGIVIGIISLTGFGLVFSMNVFKFSFGILPIALVLTMIASLILGMGLPTCACYIVTALTLAPALIKMGVEPLAAHFFVFYFAIMSTVTPPVALAAFVASGLAKSNPTKTGFTAFRLALGGFIIPYMFIYRPALLINGSSSAVLIIYSFFMAIMVIFTLAVANEKYLLGELEIWQQLLMLASTICLLLFGWKGELAAIIVVCFVMFIQYLKNKREYAKNIITDS